MAWHRWKLATRALALFSLAAPFHNVSAYDCGLESFVTRAQSNGWVIRELNIEERQNFLDHLNHDDGVESNFYPPHVWETSRAEGKKRHIRIVFFDANQCILGNSGEIDPQDLLSLLVPPTGF